MKCLCCEQDIEVVAPGDDSRGIRPNIVGGDIIVHFGYGSKVHDCVGHEFAEHHSAICDSCWEKKKHLIRTVQVDQVRSFRDASLLDGKLRRTGKRRNEK